MQENPVIIFFSFLCVFALCIWIIMLTAGSFGLNVSYIQTAAAVLSAKMIIMLMKDDLN